MESQGEAGKPSTFENRMAHSSWIVVLNKTMHMHIQGKDSFLCEPFQ